MQHLSFLLFLPFFLLPLLSSAQAEAVLGKWETDGGLSHIEIYQKGAAYYGKIVWLKEPKDNGVDKKDDKNPDERLRSRPIKGLELLKDFIYAGGNKWKNGKVYDPESGKIYSCQMTLSQPNVLEVRGYIGVSWVGRTTTWKRVKE